MLALGAQTGPVFLTYRASADVNDVAARVVAGEPLFDFTAPDGVQHTLWRVTGADRDALVSAFSRIPTLYIADGHHRAASAARARADMRQRGESPARARRRRRLQHRAGRGVSARSGADPPLQPDRQGSGRAVARRVPGGGRRALPRRAGSGRRPARRGEIAMYFDGRWQTLRPRVAPDPRDADRVARRERAAGQPARARPQDRRRPHRQAHRLRRRRARHARARAARRLGHGGRRVLAATRSASPT